MTAPATPAADYQTLEANDAKPPKTFVRKVLTSLTFWIVIGTCLGILLGQTSPHFSVKAAFMAQLFLRPIQFIVFPLVFSTLVVGIADQKDSKKLGWLALKTFIYFEIVTTLALAIGLFSVNVSKPGNSNIKKKGEYKPSSTATPFTAAAWVNHLTPKTWGEMMGGSGSSELLQVLVAAILVGVSTSQLKEEPKRLIIDFSRAVMEMMFKFVDIVIWTAPLGVCFAVANAIGANGLSSLSSLGHLVLSVYVTLIVFIIIVFGPIFLFFKINPIQFARAMQEPLIIAYTTATSEAALPAVFEALEKYGVSAHISAFVVPFGYSFNLDGSTMYLSLASVFCAQAAGVHKSIGEQIVMVLMLMISSKGVAGVRSASIIVLASTLDQFSIPQWPVALILGADWFMDMARTFTNVLGNCLASVVMAKIEGEFRTEEWHRQMRELELEAFEEDAKMSVTRNEKLSTAEH